MLSNTLSNILYNCFYITKSVVIKKLSDVIITAYFYCRFFCHHRKKTKQSIDTLSSDEFVAFFSTACRFLVATKKETSKALIL